MIFIVYLRSPNLFVLDSRLHVYVCMVPVYVPVLYYFDSDYFNFS